MKRGRKIGTLDPRKGKKYEEIYGKEKSELIKKKQSSCVRKKWVRKPEFANVRKGKTWEQFYGKEKAEEIKKKFREKWRIKYENGYVNPATGRKRLDLSEYNRKFKSEQIKGEKNPNKRIEVIEKRKKTIEGKTKEIYGQPGPENPNWKGGIAYAPYSFEFNHELKLAVKKRDNFKCRFCSAEDKDLKQGLFVHHIDYNPKNTSMDNLIAMCGSCHSKHHHERRNKIRLEKLLVNKNV